MSQTTLASLQTVVQAPSEISMSMDTVGGFESMQRAAKLFANSSIVPKAYQGQISDCFIAVDMAMRMGANPLMVMQNLYLVNGNPAWSAQFLIATFNKSGRFSALRYVFQGKEGAEDWGCRAVTTELATGERLTGPLITIDLAKKAGWYDRPNSKWHSMPEQMLRYRAAAWFVRAYAPEIAMGLQTVEEVRDQVINVDAAAPGDTLTLDALQPVEKADADAPEQQDAAPSVDDPAPAAPTKPAKVSGKKEAQPEPAGAPAAAMMITCPDTGKPVDELDCAGKPCRNGCPAFEF